MMRVSEEVLKAAKTMNLEIDSMVATGQCPNHTNAMQEYLINERGKYDAVIPYVVKGGVQSTLERGLPWMRIKPEASENWAKFLYEGRLISKRLRRTGSCDLSITREAFGKDSPIGEEFTITFPIAEKSDTRQEITIVVPQGASRGNEEFCGIVEEIAKTTEGEELVSQRWLTNDEFTEVLNLIHITLDVRQRRDLPETNES